MQPKLTREIANAAAMDAANRRMKQGGRTAWNEEDYNEAVHTFNRLWPQEYDLAEKTE